MSTDDECRRRRTRRSGPDADPAVVTRRARTRSGIRNLGRPGGRPAGGGHRPRLCGSAPTARRAGGDCPGRERRGLRAEERRRPRMTSAAEVRMTERRSQDDGSGDGPRRRRDRPSPRAISPGSSIVGGGEAGVEGWCSSDPDRAGDPAEIPSPSSGPASWTLRRRGVVDASPLPTDRVDRDSVRFRLR